MANGYEIFKNKFEELLNERVSHITIDTLDPENYTLNYVSPGDISWFQYRNDSYSLIKDTTVSISKEDLSKIVSYLELLNESVFTIKGTKVYIQAGFGLLHVTVKDYNYFDHIVKDPNEKNFDIKSKIDILEFDLHGYLDFVKNDVIKDVIPAEIILTRRVVFGLNNDFVEIKDSAGNSQIYNGKIPILFNSGLLSGYNFIVTIKFKQSSEADMEIILFDDSSQEVHLFGKEIGDFKRTAIMKVPSLNNPGYKFSVNLLKFI